MIDEPAAAGRFDAIVIGAGHNGLAAAAYLQSAGYSTVVVERAGEIGGMTATARDLLPGFAHEPHATFLNYLDIMPMVAELRLRERGLAVVVPEVQHGIAFSDGRPGIVLHRRDQLAQTVASVSRYSPGDAALLAALLERSRRLSPSLASVMYSAPSAPRAQEYGRAIEAAYSGLAIELPSRETTAIDFVDQHFESPELRTLLYLLVMEFGGSLHEQGGGVAFLGVVLWIACSRAVPLGGMGAVAESMAGAARAAGVSIMLNAGVDEIQVSDGRASGVRLDSGQVVVADRYVFSSAPRRATLASVSSSGLARSVPEPRGAGSIVGHRFCLTSAPRYASSREVPDLDRSAHTFIGFDEPQEVIDAERERAVGLLPRPGGAVATHTLVNPGHAPEGMASATVTTQFPGLDILSPIERERVAESYLPALIERWSDYAPEVAGSITASSFGAFEESDRAIVFPDAPGHYRTEVDGLYLCGTSTYPGGGVHGACAYNAVHECLQDAAVGS